MRTPVFCAVVIALIWLPRATLAQTQAAAQAGHEIAERICARCHAIGMAGESAHADAPPFRVIVARGNAANLEEALGEGMVVGHPDMPQFQLKPEDVGALIAYLKSLSGRG